MVIFISCNGNKSNDLPKILYNDLEYKLYLPDTVIINKSYRATIEFESEFDNVIDPMQAGGAALEDPTKDRLITFYHYKPVKASMNLGENLVLIDSVFVLNKSFDINNIVFKEKGEFIFYGMIIDKVRYQSYDEEGILNSVRFDKRKQQIVKKVLVVEELEYSAD